MEPIIFVFALGTFLATLAGGVLALRFRSSLPYFFSFAAGSLIAVAFLELLPDAIDGASSADLSTRYVMMTIVGAFIFYHLLERFFPTHQHGEGKNRGHGHIMGPIGAGSLVVHSFLDGAAIGVAFQVSPALGVLVALAIITHDFTDGVNTVVLMLKNRHHWKRAAGFLAADALAPVLGVISASFVSIDPKILPLLLAFFVGEFIYIGASNLMPETHKNPRARIILPMIVGILFILGVTQFV